VNIFLLKGLVREKRHWGDFVGVMQSAFPGHQIIGLDYPGVGEKNQTISPRNFKAYVEDMRSEYQSCFDGTQENVLIAISLGGMMARQWMELYPDDFKKCILMNTSFKGICPIHKRLQPQSMKTFLKLFLTRDRDLVEKGILEMVSNRKDKHPPILKNWIQYQRERPVSHKSFINQITAAMTYNAPKTPPKSELLILAGMKDRLCHYSCSENIHSVWGGKLEMHPEAGHDLAIDSPEWTSNKIKEFLS
tara:strand:+ start:588 stop:1331 length:744 start_codon:yes stop_codon:yes gene_type:complete